MSGRHRAARTPHALAGAALIAVLSVPTADARPAIEDWAAPVAHPPTERAALVRYAARFKGTPYRWGGASPAGFDCSGLVAHVYGRFGVRMAHYTGAQYAAFPKVARNRLRPGDLVFFNGLGHVGIYVGRGRFIHATNSGDHVRVSKLTERWYRDGYVGAVRPPYPRGGSSTVGPVTRKPDGIRPISSRGSVA